MGRIKGPSSVFRERLVEKDESYTANQPNYLREGIKDIGAVLTISEKIYGSPLLKDAAAGLFDLFSSDKEKVVETIKKDSDAKALKDAAAAKAMAQRKGAMADSKEAKGQVPVGPPQAKGIPDISVNEERLKQLQDLRDDPKLAAELRLAERARGVGISEYERLAELEELADTPPPSPAAGGPTRGTVKLAGEKVGEHPGPKRAAAHKKALDAKVLYEKASAQYLGATSSGDPNRVIKAQKDLDLAADAYKAAIIEYKEIQKDADYALAERGRIEKEREQNELAVSKAKLAIEMADRYVAEERDQLDISLQQQIDKAIENARRDPALLSTKDNQMIDAMAIKIADMSEEDAMQLAKDPRGQVIYALAKDKLLEQEGMLATGGDLGSALAGLEEAGAEPFAQPPGPTGPTATVATEEITEETPTATRLIGDETPVDLPGAVTAENFRKIQDDVALDYITYKPEINDAIDKLKAIYGPGAFGSTPQEVQATIRTISQSFGGGVPAQGIEVPDIAGMSIQEAEGVVMEIAASNASMSAKTKAMRKVLKQAGDLDDVVPAWMARGGSLGYLDRDMAADRLRKAFTGMIPKPKATRAPSLSEQIKLARLPDIQEGDKLKNVKARQGVIREELALPHDIKKKLLDATKGYQNLKFPKAGGGGRSGAGKKELKELEKRLDRNTNSDRKFFQSSQERIQTQVTGLQNLTVAKVMDPKNNQQIATDYGSDLAKYLQDVRSAKTDAEKQAALKKAKANIRNDLRARAKNLKDKQDKLTELSRKLNLELLNKDMKKKEALLREINELWADIQKGI